MKRNHRHIYDVNGKPICCSLEEKIDRNTPPPLLKNKHSEDDGHNHSHDHSHKNKSNWKVYLPAYSQLHFTHFRVLP
jgi:Cd2+/Zn2+-exporting ATPase